MYNWRHAMLLLLLLMRQLRTVTVSSAHLLVNRRLSLHSCMHAAMQKPPAGDRRQQRSISSKLIDNAIRILALISLVLNNPVNRLNDVTYHHLSSTL